MQNKLARPVIFGEVLYDRFPDGQAVLGGAPFNVAWHLQGFGLSPLMVTAIGDDEAGDQIGDRMRAWGMDMSAVQVSATYPTGQVEISFTSGEPSYVITEQQAYDHINAEVAITAINSTELGETHHKKLIYHGSLIERTEESQQTLQKILSLAQTASFVDINLRPPWWNMERVTSGLQAATWVKLNEEELATIMAVETSADVDLQVLGQQFFKRFEVQLLIVTRGGEGAFLICDHSVINAEPVNVENIVDTVGAGDSFSAVMIAGMLFEWPLALRLQRALQFAASVCQNQGATTADKSLYADYLAQWSS